MLKIGHASELAATITAFGLGLPGPLVATFAIALPPLEVLLGAYLVGGWLLPIASVAATLLLGSFIAVLSSVVARGLSAPCGCFGPGDVEPTTWATVARDAAFLLPALYLTWWSRVRDEA